MFRSAISSTGLDDEDPQSKSHISFHEDVSSSRVLEELKEVFRDGTKIVSTHNGLGTEDVIAETFGAGRGLPHVIELRCLPERSE